jgi:hypothetical protein
LFLSLAACAYLEVNAMRLINTATFEITLFLQSQLPEYAILSHTWGDQEVSLQDMQSGTASGKKGYVKIVGCCKKAAEDGYIYCWVDTVCIDKTSSAELSEAINSMYRWYQRAAVCYVYLEDLLEPSAARFAASRWFTRGWTLQELIAPAMVEFYDASWKEYGTRTSLHFEIATITGIDPNVLIGEDTSVFNVATKMSWAARRTTTRVEDEAYCLMGLFQVNMPLLYGEGRRAFRRLQEEIIRAREDYTIFVWQSGDSPYEKNMAKWYLESLLADSPANFGPLKIKLQDEATGREVEYISEHSVLSERPFLSVTPDSVDSIPFSFTSRGLNLTLPLHAAQGKILACVATLEDPRDTSCLLIACVGLMLETEKGKNNYRRSGPIIFLPEIIYHHGQFQLRTIYVYQPNPVELYLPWLDVSSDRHTLVALQKSERSNTRTPLSLARASMLTTNGIVYNSKATRNHFRNTSIKTAPDSFVLNQGLDHAAQFIHRSSNERNELDFMLDNPNSRFCVSFKIGYEGAFFGVGLRLPQWWEPYCQCSDIAATTDFIEHGWHNNDRLTLCMYIDRTGMDTEGHQISMRLRRMGALPALLSSRRFVFSVDHRVITSHGIVAPIGNVIEIQRVQHERPLLGLEAVVFTIDADPDATRT